jgi:ribosomal protein S18 acetylase RimI-like enzyme
VSDKQQASDGVRIVTELRRQHRDALAEMLRSTPAFNRQDVALALDLADQALDDAKLDDYHFVLAEQDRRILGYVCYGPTPLARGTYDVYWLATHPAARRRGIARALMTTMEALLRRAGGRVLRIETSSLADYEAARRFYLANGYQLISQLRDFWKPGEDLVTYAKHLCTSTMS